MSGKPDHQPDGDPCSCGAAAAYHRARRSRSGEGHRGARRRAVWEDRIIAVDGEGWGLDSEGRQNYMLLVAADESGWQAHAFTGSRLTTHQCLAFIWTLPTAHLTSYSFGYDAAMILRDLPYDVQMRVQQHPEDQPITWWRGWGIEYVKGKKLLITRRGGGGRVVYDAFGFHQKSFARCMADFDPWLKWSADEGAVIAAGKARRGTESAGRMPDELTYSAAECKALARIQRLVYQAHKDAGYPLSTYLGAGSSAVAMLRRHGIKEKLPEQVSGSFARAVDWSYIGGRFETDGHGFESVLYEADIRNAYPAAASEIPCMAPGHGHWRRCKGRTGGRVGLYHVYWAGRPDMRWGPFCMRMESGEPTWPYAGHGLVWGDEFDAGCRLPVEWHLPPTVVAGWEWISECDCPHPFDFLPPVFLKRLEFKAAGSPLEKPFKLGPNSVYGKMAQRVGKAQYHSLIWAAMITSATRARLLRAIETPRAYEAAAMMATDAIYSRVPLDLDYSVRLGAWEDNGGHDDVTIVQPGVVYWHDPSKGGEAQSKTRGLPASAVPWPQLGEVWRRDWSRLGPQAPYIVTPDHEPDGDPCSCGYARSGHLSRFCGLGLAAVHGQDGYLGRWERVARRIEFASHKRPFHVLDPHHDYWRTSYGWGAATEPAKLHAWPLVSRERIWSVFTEAGAEAADDRDRGEAWEERDAETA